MREVILTDVEGVRCVPDEHRGVGALVLAGSSGRIDSDRAGVLAANGALAESVRWFGGHGQHDGPWEIPIEFFLGRLDSLRKECDRLIVVGTSFGAEAALLTGTFSENADSVIAFAPSDVVWAGVSGDGRVTSHWSYDGVPLPFVHIADDWTPPDDPPAYVDLYRHSRVRFDHEVAAAAIPVERVDEVVLIAGGDDKVWPSIEHAEHIRARRAAHGRATTLVTDDAAGHRTILPGEPMVAGGMRMRRGGTESADRRLGRSAWPHIASRLA